MAQLGAYEVETEIGRGSMGCVLRARHRATGAVRAIKVLTLTTPDVELVARFNRESELLARVGGEGVVRVHETGTHLGNLYYVMDLVEGGSLRDRLKKSGALKWRDAVSLAARVARALHRCHEAGIVHRDMKLENVLVDDEGAPLLTDFGIARDLGARSLTATGALMGSPSTMAPEQIRGEAVDRRADLYALGVMLYELVTGTKPYSGETWVDLSRSIERGKRPTTQDTAGAPPGLDEILGRCLAPRREGRYATALDAATDLEALLRVYQPRKARGPRRLLLWIWVAIGAVLAINAGIFAWTRVGKKPPPAVELDVTLTAPTSGAYVCIDSSIVVRGTAHGATSELLVNGQRVEVGEGGAFETTVKPGHDGENTVLIVARDPEGKKVERRRVVFVGPKAPAWFIEIPKELRPDVPLPKGLEFGEQPGEYLHPRDGSVLVFVPGGKCRLGAENDDPLARDAFDADLGPFWIGKYEVTNALFAKFVAETEHTTLAEKRGAAFHDYPADTLLAVRPEDRQNQISSELRGAPFNWKQPYPDEKPWDPRLPVVCVSWFDARAYVEWAGLSLPSEDQWEKAAVWDPVAKKHTRYPWGDEPGGRVHGNFRDASFYRVANLEPSPITDDDGFPWGAPVGRFEDDRSPVGAFDMAGNVSEWCGDLHPAKNKTPTLLSSLISLRGGAFRVVRGGSFTIPVAWMDTADRMVVPGEVFCGTGTGFRVAFIPPRRG